MSDQIGEARQDFHLIEVILRSECGHHGPELHKSIERVRQALERERVPEGCSIVGDNVLRFLHGEAPLFGERFHERAEKEKGVFWWRKYLPRPAAPGAGTGDIGKALKETGAGVRDD